MIVESVLMCSACGFMSSCGQMGEQCPSDGTVLLPRATLDGRREDGNLGRTLAGRFVVLSPPAEAAVAVYGAYDLSEGAPVSIKLVPPMVSDALPRVHRLVREARALKRMAHPTLPRVRATGRTPDGVTWMALEALEGISLRRLIDTEGQIGPNRAINITLRVLAALDRLHAAGLVHGALEPASVLVVPGGLRGNDEIKLLDCGAAAVPGEGAPSADCGVGPGYRAPEQFTGRTEPISDIYAAGLLLYEMLAGRPPFEVGLSFERMLHHCRLRVPPLGLPSAFATLEEVVYRALDKDPARRWRQARAMAVALKAAFVTRDGERLSASTAPPPVAPPKPAERVSTSTAPGTRSSRLRAALAMVTSAVGAVSAA